MKDTTNEQSELKAAASILARSGGRAVVKKYGKDYMRKLSEKAVKARQKNRKNKDVENNT